MKNQEKAQIIPMSSKAKKEISKIAESLKGQVLFKEKVERAKKTLSKIKSLPI